MPKWHQNFALKGRCLCYLPSKKDVFSYLFLHFATFELKSCVGASGWWILNPIARQRKLEKCILTSISEGHIVWQKFHRQETWARSLEGHKCDSVCYISKYMFPCVGTASAHLDTIYSCIICKALANGNHSDEKQCYKSRGRSCVVVYTSGEPARRPVNIKKTPHFSLFKM